MRLPAVLLLLAAGACATATREGLTPLEVPYQPLEVPLTSSAAAVLEGTRVALLARGFQITQREASGLVGLRDPGDGTRDRASVQVAGGMVRIDVRTELQGDNGEWIRANNVTRDYRHVREWELAGQIREKILMAAR